MAGIFQALLSFPLFLRENPHACDLIRRSVDYLLRLCHDNANIATNLEAALSGNGKFLVHWCHGAAGENLPVFYVFYCLPNVVCLFHLWYCSNLKNVYNIIQATCQNSTINVTI